MKAFTNTRRPGARLIAGLSMVGLAGALLTGCSGDNNPDGKLCDDATKALKDAGIEKPTEVLQIEDSAKMSKLGQDLKAAAENSKSDLAEPVNLLGKSAELAAKVKEDPSNADQLKSEMDEIGNQLRDEDNGEKAKELSKKCDAFKN